MLKNHSECISLYDSAKSIFSNYQWEEKIFAGEGGRKMDGEVSVFAF